MVAPYSMRYRRQHKYRRQHPKTFSTNIVTLQNSVQVNVKFCVRKKVFIYFIFRICLKRMGLNLSTSLSMFAYSFQAMWRHRPLEEYSAFVRIRAAHTSFSPFTLEETASKWRTAAWCTLIWMDALFVSSIGRQWNRLAPGYLLLVLNKISEFLQCFMN